MHIRDVNLDNRCLQRADAVLQSYRCVGVGSCIQHDTIVAEAHLLHLVNQNTLDVALKVLDVYIGEAVAQLRQVGVERRRTIDAWLPLAQQVQVRTIDNQNLHFQYKCINTAAKVRISEQKSKFIEKM